MATITIAIVNDRHIAFYKALQQHKIGGCMLLNSNGTAELTIDENNVQKVLAIWRGEISKR